MGLFRSCNDKRPLRKSITGGHPGVSDTEDRERDKNLAWLFEPLQSGKQDDLAVSVN